MGQINLSIWNYPDTPITTAWIVQWFDAINNTWLQAPEWVAYDQPIVVTGSLDHMAVIIITGNYDPNDPNREVRHPATGAFELTGPYAPIQYPLVDGSSYVVNLNCGKSMTLESGGWKPNICVPAKSTNWLVPLAVVGGAVLVAVSLIRKK